MPRMIINLSIAHLLRATLMACSGDILGGRTRDRSKTQERTLKSPPQHTLFQGGKVQENDRTHAQHPVLPLRSVNVGGQDPHLAVSLFLLPLPHLPPDLPVSAISPLLQGRLCSGDIQIRCQRTNSNEDQ